MQTSIAVVFLALAGLDLVAADSAPMPALVGTESQASTRLPAAEVVDVVIGSFFRMSKRGCTSEPSGRSLIDRSVFSEATPSVLLDDYVKGLDALRERKEIDPSRIVLSGASEPGR